MYIDLILTICIFTGLFLLIRRGSVRQTNNSQAGAQWLKRSRRVTAECARIAGNWSGAYEYERGFDVSGREIDRTFVANISYESGCFSGRIGDSLGDAEIHGICEYPVIRFKKTYVELSSELGGFGTLLYRGKFKSEEEVIGEWHAEAGNGFGTWRMTRLEGDSVAE